MRSTCLNGAWFLVFFLCLPAWSLDRGNLRCYFPFENSLKPLIANGDTQIQVTGGSEKDVVFVKGKRGMGVKLKAGLGINYTNKDIFSPREGTVACWVKPVGWHKSDGLNHVFVRICGDAVCFLLYKFYPGNTWVYLEGKGKTTVVGGYWDEFEEDKWTFLTFTFKPGEQAWYINGQLQSRKTEELIEPEFLKTALVQIADSQVMDELMVFDRALTEQEVKALHKANA